MIYEPLRNPEEVVQVIEFDSAELREFWTESSAKGTYLFAEIYSVKVWNLQTNNRRMRNLGLRLEFKILNRSSSPFCSLF